MAVQNYRGNRLTFTGCCDIVKITRGVKYLTLGNYGFKVQIDYCENCGSMKSTSRIKEYNNMAGDTLFAEKAGKHLKAEIFDTGNGSSIRFFINEEFIKETTYADKTVQDARLVAENWINSVEVLKG